jgi:hypothetical protein
MEAPIKVVIISAILIAALLITLLISYYFLTTSDDEKVYSITFDNSTTTLQQGNLSMVLDYNNRKGSKILSISDLVPEPTKNIYSIYASVLSKDSNIINYSNIIFKDRKFQTSYGYPALLYISVNKPFEIGEYHGWFTFLGPNTFSIPITLSTPPLYFESILIIAIGALTSMIMMELTKHTGKKIVNGENTLATKELNIFKGVLPPGSTAFVGLQPEMQTYIINLERDKMISDYKIKAYDARYAGPAAAAKNALLSLVPGIFALLIAIFGFVNNETVGEVIEFNFQNVFTLFVLGVGIESTKTLLDRIKVDTTLRAN